MRQFFGEIPDTEQNSGIAVFKEHNPYKVTAFGLLRHSIVFPTCHTSKQHQELFVLSTQILYARHGSSHVRMAAVKMSVTGVIATMTFQPITLDFR